jgi:biotin synthase
MEIRHDWARDEIPHIYHLPLPELILRAQLAHRAFHKPDEIQLCRLLSIKTGGCPEDCAYSRGPLPSRAGRSSATP